jgi:hypothetical protein
MLPICFPAPGSHPKLSIIYLIFNNKVILSSRGSGNTPGRHYDRSARSSLDWDRLKTGNARQGRVPGSA